MVMSDFQTSGNGASRAGHLVLLRHGETVWSVSGQHTGRTDLPLTGVGERQAVEAGARIRKAYPDGFGAYVFSSPLGRAKQTAQCAGFDDARICAGLAEWDYGRAEGRTRAQLSEALGRNWDLWSDGTESLGPELEGDHIETLPSGQQVNVHNGPGETIAQAAARAAEVAQEMLPMILAGQDVLLVAHAHILRILTTQWLGLDPHMAKMLRLDTAHYSSLGVYKGDRVIEHWNV
jgi:probable phosphoglycerate mutase